jgi:hypothetical protein
MGWMDGSKAKGASKFAQRDHRMKTLVQPDERFVGTFGMLTRDRAWFEFIWSDAALYYRPLKDEHFGEIVRVPLAQISAVSYGAPPPGTYGFLETAHDVMVVSLESPPVKARRASGWKGSVETGNVAISEVPTLAVSNGTGLDAVFVALRRHQIKVADLTGRHS